MISIKYGNLINEPQKKLPSSKMVKTIAYSIHALLTHG